MGELEDKLKSYEIPLELDQKWRLSYISFVDKAPDDYVITMLRVCIFELAYRIANWNFTDKEKMETFPSSEVVQHVMLQVVDNIKKSYKERGH